MLPDAPHSADAEASRSAGSLQETISAGDTASSSAALEHALAPGATIGRYLVLGRLGTGGMGVVFAVYDPELDRKVAIKVLYRGPTSHDESRLLREAQALARLSHPNVVAVHDVGTALGRVWIAMELVSGKTLGAWLRERPRPWPEVLAALGAAARGLVAAHVAGLVHGDFKPDNVMVGDDPHGAHAHERVRVMDFGLAHQNDDEPETGRYERTAHGEGASARTGRIALVGTLAYMAPEQLAGLASNARTDQFAFCVTAWEALFGERPFAASSIAELAVEVLAGRRRPPPRGTRVPSWLRHAIERGLAPDPEARWPTMAALLSALERGRARARMRRIVAGATVVALGMGAVFGARALVSRDHADQCRREGEEIATVWNDDVRDDVVASIRASGRSYAESTADKVVPWLDAYAHSWQDARSEACLDARVRGRWDDSTLDRARWCLDERKRELAALVSGLQRGGSRAVTAAVWNAAELPRTDACRDAERLERSPLPPAIDREQIAAVRDELSHATAPRFAGDFAEAIANTREITERIDAIAWPPLTAEGRLRLAALLQRTGDVAEAESVLQDAYFVATTAGALELAAEAAGQLVHLTGYKLGRQRDGFLWSRHELTALTMLGDTEGLRMAGHLDRRADLHLAAGEYDEAGGLYAHAMEIHEAELGAEHPSIANDLASRANVSKNTGAYADARELLTRALAITEQTLGPDHPEIAAMLTNLSHVELATGHQADAEAMLRRALDIRERALGLEHVELVPTLLNLGAVRLEASDLAGAEQLFRRALSIAQAELGPDHPHVGAALSNLALTLTRRGASVEAAEAFTRALAIQERALGPDHPDLATSLFNLAGLHEQLGEYAVARPLFERALSIAEKALGPDHSDVADALVGLAELALLEERWADGVALAERAVGVYERGDATPDAVAHALFVLARARWSAGRDRDGALATARDARERLVGGGDRSRPKIAEIDTWLTTRAR